MRDKLDAMNDNFNGKLDAINEKFDGKFDALTSSINRTKVWALALYIALAGTLFGTLARGFGWI